MDYLFPHTLQMDQWSMRRNHSISQIFCRFSAYKRKKSLMFAELYSNVLTRARKKVGEKCHNLTQNACFLLYINALRCVRFCMTFHVIAWDFSPFAQKNISECSILADAGRTRTEQVRLYKRWYKRVPAVVHKSTSSGTNKYQLRNSAGTRIPSARPSKGKFIQIGADSRVLAKKCYAKTGILRIILRSVTH